MLEMASPISSLWFSPMLCCAGSLAHPLLSQCYVAWTLGSSVNTASDSEESQSGREGPGLVLLLPLNAVASSSGSFTRQAQALSGKEELLLRTYAQRTVDCAGGMESRGSNCVFRWGRTGGGVIVSPTHIPGILFLMRVPDEQAAASQEDTLLLSRYGLSISSSLQSILSDEVSAAWTAALHRFSIFMPQPSPNSPHRSGERCDTDDNDCEEYSVEELSRLLDPPQLRHSGGPGALRPTPPSSAHHHSRDGQDDTCMGRGNGPPRRQISAAAAVVGSSK
ncbi:unnamed protein product [Symbiodinium microadriaticum]|nr:unnamed protein product [Symbiodinium microadriaticum]